MAIDISGFPEDVQAQIRAKTATGAQNEPSQPKLKKNKYCVVKDGKYDSKAERHRHGELLAMQECGEISNVKLHGLSFRLGRSDLDKVISYKPDFTYWDNRTETFVIEEVKGVRVRDWPARAALFKEQWGMFFELRVVSVKRKRGIR